jgi:hypothetical protein
MEQDEAIGFIVGLEAPVYAILGLMKQSLLAVGISEAVVTRSEYMVIHDAMDASLLRFNAVESLRFAFSLKWWEDGSDRCQQNCQSRN